VTHIFDGISEWATHLTHLENGSITKFGKLQELPDLAAIRAQREGRVGDESALLLLVQHFLYPLPSGHFSLSLLRSFLVPSCPSFLPFSLSPFLPFSVSPFLPFSLSPFLPFSLSPFLPFSLSPFLPFSLSPSCYLPNLMLSLSLSLFLTFRSQVEQWMRKEFEERKKSRNARKNIKTELEIKGEDYKTHNVRTYVSL
jgi:hypothetical protein